VFLLYSLPLLMASAGTCRKRIAVNRLHGASMALIEYCIETSDIAGWRRDIPVLNPCSERISHLNQCIEPDLAGFSMIPASAVSCVVPVDAGTVYS
jgi:hypothetical protein